MENVNPADIPVVILAGGKGTRIREASESLPKPMIDVGGKPIVWHIMKTYAAHGHRRLVLLLGYKSWTIGVRGYLPEQSALLMRTTP